MLLGFVQHLPVHDPLLDHLRQTPHFRLPANNVRLVSFHVGFRLRQLGNRRLEFALGHHDQLLRLLDHLPVQLDLGHLLLMVFAQFGDKNLHQQVAFFHLLADVYVDIP